MSSVFVCMSSLSFSVSASVLVSASVTSLPRPRFQDVSVSFLRSQSLGISLLFVRRIRLGPSARLIRVTAGTREPAGSAPAPASPPAPPPSPRPPPPQPPARRARGRGFASESDSRVCTRTAITSCQEAKRSCDAPAVPWGRVPAGSLSCLPFTAGRCRIHRSISPIDSVARANESIGTKIDRWMRWARKSTD